jgi:2-polyprenyl-3-methyl-5-hydroxy-6-metoxy-1,4-benzoquinol methylase
MICTVCNKKMGKGLELWHFRCDSCRHESAEFKDEINNSIANENLDEDLRLEALRPIRDANFKQIIGVLNKNGFNLKNKSSLDVGCAHGWFMAQLRGAGSKPVRGIEPDKRIFDKFSKDVTYGYFPNVLSKKDKFDLISFNDVLEHIPDTRETLRGCMEHLNDNGLLVLNLPSSQGMLYRTSKLLHKVGLRIPFERLWQKGLPSPHVHYYNPQNLNRLALDMGFKTVHIGKLQSVSRSGLKERIGYDASDKSLIRKLKNYALYISIYIMSPILNILPSDIQLIILQK